ncbi:PKD domain-containing protein [Patescibacteria group bacterium]|nr:PKD domain-containing protein [Patescibacteria group bacterium]
MKRYLFFIAFLFIGAALLLTSPLHTPQRVAVYQKYHSAQLATTSAHQDLWQMIKQNTVLGNLVPTANAACGSSGGWGSSSFWSSPYSSSQYFTPSYSYSWSGAVNGGLQTESTTFYSPGTYTAHVTASDGYGDSATGSCSVTVSQPPPMYVSCGAYPNPATPGQSVDFSAYASGGSGSGYSYSWSGAVNGYGQTAYNTFSQPGTYNAYVTTTDSFGDTAFGNCSVSVIAYGMQVNANLSGVNIYSTVSGGGSYPVPPYTIIMGSPFTTVLTAPLVYTSPYGTYVFSSWVNDPSIALSDNGVNGSQDVATAQVSTSTGAGQNYPTATAQYIAYAFSIDPTANPTSGVAPLTVNFAANPYDNFPHAHITYSWNFGDGSTSNAENPQHTFQKVGQYAVSLSATDNITGVTRTAQVTINAQYALPKFRETQ